MNRKIDLLYGALVAIATTAFGAWLVVVLFTDWSFSNGIRLMYNDGKLGKIIALGAILSLDAFFVLLRYKRDLMARGVILGLLIMTVLTLLV